MEVDQGEAKNLSHLEAELFLFLGGSGPLTLQVRMMCQCEEDGHVNGSWQFSFNGQMCLLFDSENGSWSVAHSGWSHMKEKWENDRVVTDFLKKVSMGDCRAWLQDFMVHWEETMKITGK